MYIKTAPLSSRNSALRRSAPGAGAPGIWLRSLRCSGFVCEVNIHAARQESSLLLSIQAIWSVPHENRAQLLYKTQVLRSRPAFQDFAIYDAEDLDGPERDISSCLGHAHGSAPISAASCSAGHDLIALGDQVLYGDSKIVEGVEEDGHRSPDTLGACRSAGGSVVVKKVGGHDFVNDRQLSLVDHLVDKSAHDGLIFF